jgi:thiamine pyrophosphokinase
MDFFEKQNTKIILKNEQSTPDLCKCLYYSLEKISEKVGNEDFNMMNGKVSSIFILGMGDRFDYTFSLMQTVHQYISTIYSLNTEFYLVSKSSLAVFLKNGINWVTPSGDYNNPAHGYSIICLNESVNVTISEFDGENEKETVNKTLGHPSVFFRKNFKGDRVKIILQGVINGFVLFSCTSKFHDV